MMYKNQSGSSERANEIRAEIARLQQELASLGEGDQSEYSPEFFNWIKSQESAFKNQGRLEYFNVDANGNLVLDPNLAANQAELLRFKKAMEQGKAYELKEKEKRKQEAFAKYKREQSEQYRKQQEETRKIFESNAMDALSLIKQDPTRKIADAYVKFLQEKGLLPEGYGTQAQATSTPSLANAPVIGQSSAKPMANMPPAWS